MFVDFFYQLREARIPVTIREFLTFLEALDKGVARGNIDEFYFLSRASLVKDERFFDTFDLVFGNFFQGAMNKTEGLLEEYIPEDWLQGVAREMFSEEEIEEMSFEELMEELAKRLQEQDGQHHGGNRWIGTGGTSPFGNSGQNPRGFRMGGEGGGKSATKMWQKRDFCSLRGETEIGTRNMKMALRRLRRVRPVVPAGAQGGAAAHGSDDHEPGGGGAVKGALQGGRKGPDGDDREGRGRGRGD